MTTGRGRKDLVVHFSMACSFDRRQPSVASGDWLPVQTHIHCAPHGPKTSASVRHFSKPRHSPPPPPHTHDGNQNSGSYRHLIRPGMSHLFHTVVAADKVIRALKLSNNCFANPNRHTNLSLAFVISPPPKPPIAILTTTAPCTW